MSKQMKSRSDYDFLLYRIEVLEKRIDQLIIQPTESSSITQMLLKELLKQHNVVEPIAVCKTSHVASEPTVTNADDKAESAQQPLCADALLSFARRRTIV